MNTFEINSENFKFTSNVDNALIFFRKWTPSIDVKVTASIQLTHGICEHSGRYERFGKFLASKGFVVYALDLRGHGMTAGPDKLGQGGLDTWGKMTADIKQLADIAKAAYPDLPLFAFGHSMGSALTQSHIQKNGSMLAGAILCGTLGRIPEKSEAEIQVLFDRLHLLGTSSDADKPCEFMGELLTTFNAPFTSNTKMITGCEWQTQDAKEVQGFLNDPLCGQPFSNSMTYSIIKGFHGLWNQLDESQIPNNLPILIICGQDDPVGEQTRSVQELITRYMSYGHQHLSYVFYSGQRHEILNEPCKEQVHSDVNQWLNWSLNLAQKNENKLFVLQIEPARICLLDLSTRQVEIILNIDSGIPDGIQFNQSNQKLYWTCMGDMPEHGEKFTLADGKIECFDLSTKEQLEIIGDGTIITPKQLQLDPDAEHLYWCDREGMAIYRSNLNGDELTELYRAGEWPKDSSDEMRHCVGIALDLHNGHLYWTQKGSPDGGEGRIFRMSLEIPSGQSSTTRTDVELLIDGLPEPIDLEIDEDAKQIYWTDRGLDKKGGNSLNRADIKADGLKNHQILAVGLKEGIGLALDKKQRKAYVSDLSGTVSMVSMDGGAFETVHLFSGPVTGITFKY